MNDLQPSGSGISHNPYALSSFAPSHSRRDSNQTVVPAPSIASFRPPPPPVLILNSLSPVWETKPSSPKKSRRQSGSGWELSNGSLPSNMADESILSSLRRAVSPFRQPDTQGTKHTAYHPPSISTPTSLRSRSNSSSSSIPPITPNEATPPSPPPKPYHYTKRSQSYPIVPDKPPNPRTMPLDLTKEMPVPTKRHPELIRLKEKGNTTNPSRTTSSSHSDPDLSQSEQLQQQHTRRQHDDASSLGTHTHSIIRELEPPSQSSSLRAKHSLVRERTKGAEISSSTASPSPPMIVPSRRKESLPQPVFTSSKDDINLHPQQSPTQLLSPSSSLQRSDSMFVKSWGRQRDQVGITGESRRASSIFQPHLVPNPTSRSHHTEGRITEQEEEEVEPPGTPGIRRKDERNGWSGEWNVDTIQEVIEKLRALR